MANRRRHSLPELQNDRELVCAPPVSERDGRTETGSKINQPETPTLALTLPPTTAVVTLARKYWA